MEDAKFKSAAFSYCEREISNELCATYMECVALHGGNVSEYLHVVTKAVVSLRQGQNI